MCRHAFLLITSVLISLTLLMGCADDSQNTAQEPSGESETTAVADPDAAKIQEYANPDYIVTAAQARQMLNERDDILLLDVRRSAQYLLGHIPGAIQIFRGDYGAAEFGEGGPYPFGGMVASREEMATLLGQLGATPETLIMTYDASGDYDAARIWWMLDMYGHKNVTLIDGGINAWQDAGFDVNRLGSPDITPTDYSFPVAEDRSKYATVEDVEAAIFDEDVVILDTRSMEEVTGESIKSGAYRAGHIPTSAWVEYKLAINEDTTFKSAEELRAMYESIGVTPDKTIIAFCQSGVRSSHTTFVLSQLLGYENVMNYDGSWIEWSYDDSLPLEVGLPEARVTLD